MRFFTASLRNSSTEKRRHYSLPMVKLSITPRTFGIPKTSVYNSCFVHKRVILVRTLYGIALLKNMYWEFEMILYFYVYKITFFLVRKFCTV
jgi:hypothetical protein